MKFEEVLQTPRLSPDKEITIDGVHEYYRDIDKMEDEELLSHSQKLQEQINLLQKDSQGLDELDSLVAGYVRGEDKLATFKESKQALKDVVDKNSDKLEELGVISFVDTLESERLMNTDEVKQYKDSKKELKDSVSRIARQKKKTKKVLNRVGEDVSFRSSERKDSIMKANNVSSKIRGSIQALKTERARLIEELSQRAREYFLSVIKERDKEKHLILMENSDKQGLIEQYKRQLVEVASKFGIESVAHIGQRPQEQVDLLRDAVFSYEVIQELRVREEIQEKIKEKKETLINLEKQRIELEAHLLGLFGKRLKDLPLNIQVKTSEGYQGLHVDEGEVIAYAYNYDGLDQLQQIEEKIKSGQDRLQTLLDMYKKHTDSKTPEQLNGWKKRINSLFSFLSSKEKSKEEDELDSRIKIIKQNIEKAESELIEAQQSVKVTREPIQINKYIKNIDLENYLYIHDNYGRGYNGARAKHSMQTVADFFSVFKEKLEKEILELQEDRKDEFLDRCIELQKMYTTE